MILKYFVIIFLWIINDHKCCELKFGHLAQSANKGVYYRGGVSSINALNIAIIDFNSRSMPEMTYLFPNLLSHNCTISVLRTETDSTSKLTITSGLNMSSNFQSLGLTIPVIFGMRFSSLSQLLSPMVEAFELLHISASATSTFLTNYPNFYRSIGDDDMQSLGQIKLCNHFGWDKIGVVHMASSYGTSLGRSITKWGEIYNISVQAFSYIEEDSITIIDTAQSMKSSDLKIFILVIYPNDWNLLTEQLKTLEMIGYPHYYLGTDSLWYENIYESDSLLNKSYDGMIGTCKWSVINTTTFDNLPYSYPLNESILKYDYLKNRFPVIENGNSSIATYEYDNAMAMLFATEKYIDLYGYYYDNINAHIDNISMANFSMRYANILKSIAFIGLSGNVSFDNNGDRRSGLFGYCNFANNEITKIGYFEPPEFIVLNDKNISWPKDFANIPRSSYIIHDSDSQYSALQLILYGLGGMVSLIILIYITYFCVKFCKKFQDNFNVQQNISDNEGQKLLHKEKKRLFISITSDFICSSIGLGDFLTDILSLITIISVKNLYSDWFVVLYFAISVISSFVFCAHFTITFKNMIHCYYQLKSGLIDGIDILLGQGNNQQQEKRDSKQKKMSALSSTQRQMNFKMNILEKIIKQETTIIFVALFEDLPFFILNFYGLIQQNITWILLLSFSFNGVSLGYKMCVTKGFFQNLQELGYLKENITNIIAHKQNVNGRKGSIVQSVKRTVKNAFSSKHKVNGSKGSIVPATEE